MGRQPVWASRELRAQAQDYYFSQDGYVGRPCGVAESKMLTSWQCFFGRRLSVAELAQHRPDTGTHWRHERAG